MRKTTEQNTALLNSTSEDKNSQTRVAEALNQTFDQEVDPHFEARSREAWRQSSDQIDVSVAARIKARLLEQIVVSEPLSAVAQSTIPQPIPNSPSTPSQSITARQSLSKRLLGPVAKIAVAASVLVATTVGGYWFAMSGLQSQSFEVATLKGQRSSVTLPDGSVVRLNSESRLVYTAAFNRGDRKIEMEGEAYFEVAKNTQLPFTVTADGVDVTALGTKFNVRAYANDAQIVTTLVEGKVAVEVAGNKEIILPNQQVRCNRGDRQLSVRVVGDNTHLVPWINNELMFDGQSLCQIASELERMYDVRIAFKGEKIKNYRYTGIVLNSSLANVLELITTTSPVTYQMNENTIEFSQKNHTNL